MSDYTPTTSEVEDRYAYDEWDVNPQEEEAPRRERFRHWLAAELAAAERRGAVRALRRFAFDLGTKATEPWNRYTPAISAAWDLADRIEGGA